MNVISMKIVHLWHHEAHVRPGSPRRHVPLLHGLLFDVGADARPHQVCLTGRGGGHHRVADGPLDEGGGAAEEVLDIADAVDATVPSVCLL